VLFRYMLQMANIFEVGNTYQNIPEFVIAVFPPPPMVRQPLMGQGLLILDAYDHIRHSICGKIPLGG
jgi:hypothetical protein